MENTVVKEVSVIECKTSFKADAMLPMFYSFI